MAVWAVLKLIGAHCFIFLIHGSLEVLNFILGFRLPWKWDSFPSHRITGVSEVNYACSNWKLLLGFCLFHTKGRFFSWLEAELVYNAHTRTFKNDSVRHSFLQWKWKIVVAPKLLPVLLSRLIRINVPQSRLLGTLQFCWVHSGLYKETELHCFFCLLLEYLFWIVKHVGQLQIL